MGEDLMVQLLDLRAQSFNNERRRLNEQLHAVRTLLLNTNNGVRKKVKVASGKSGPKDQVALHYYYTSPSHWCTTHDVSKL